MLIQHPLSKLFPPMAAEEYRELVEDIRRQGVLEPIILLDGMVLEGWNRYSACQEIGMECPSRPWEGNADDDALFHYVWGRNAVRRHLTPAQRIDIIAKRHPQDWEAVGTQQGGWNKVDAPQLCSPKVAAERIASESGVSVDSVWKAKRIERDDSDLWRRATSGEVSLTVADGIRIGNKVNQKKQKTKTRQEKKEMEWRTHFVKEVIDKIKAIEKVRTEIQTGLAHERFAPEAKPFIIRELDKAITALTKAQEELRT